MALGVGTWKCTMSALNPLLVAMCSAVPGGFALAASCASAPPASSALMTSALGLADITLWCSGRCLHPRDRDIRTSIIFVEQRPFRERCHRVRYRRYAYDRVMWRGSLVDVRIVRIGARGQECLDQGHAPSVCREIERRVVDAVPGGDHYVFRLCEPFAHSRWS